MITTLFAAILVVLPLAPSFNSDEQAYLRELHNDNIPVSDDPATVAVGRSLNVAFQPLVFEGVGIELRKQLKVLF